MNGGFFPFRVDNKEKGRFRNDEWIAGTDPDSRIVGYHWSETLASSEELDLRTYIPEPNPRHYRRLTDKPPERETSGQLRISSDARIEDHALRRLRDMLHGGFAAVKVEVSKLRLEKNRRSGDLV